MPILRPIAPTMHQVSDENPALAAWKYPGEGPPILFCHCTGTCARIWDPVITRLSIANTIIAPDARGHGNSGKPEVAKEYTWRGFAEDILRILDAEKIPDGAWAVGHSGGASAIVCAELMQPGRFSRIVLIDPIIAPPAFFSDALSLVKKTRKRQEIFASRREVKEQLGNKIPMNNWSDDALNAYASYGFSECEDGSVRLNCPREIEAWIYEYGGIVNLYDRLDEVRAKTLLITGKDSYMAEHVHYQHSRLPHAALITLPDTGHFIPQEKPDETADLISDWFRPE